MKILDKLLRRKDDLGLDKPSYQPLNDELGLGELKSEEFPMQQAQENMAPAVSPFRNVQPNYPGQYGQQQMPPPAQQGASRDIELVLSKLDTIRSLLTNLDLRIARLEKVAGVDEKEKYKW
ncbi:MAG TPA: hypothetical protein VJH88_02430 [Candidatus Nanoarchaeia archaeon]|nr:hypothetical protein [Candidatus Nanoarchaeia archaeon]